MDYFNLGYQSFNQVLECHLREGSIEHEQWLAGHSQAQEEHEDILNRLDDLELGSPE